MRKNTRPILKNLLIGVIVLTFFTPVSFIAQAHETTDANAISTLYTFSPPTTSKITLGTHTYDQIFLTNAPVTGGVGEPKLPVKGAYLLLPPGTTVDHISVTGQKELFGSGFQIVPCGKPIPIGMNVIAPLPTPDPTIYTSTSLFPESLYTLVGVYQCKGYTIAVLELHPVQYRPSTGEIYYFTTMTVTITEKADTNVNKLYRGLSQDRQDVLNMIDNPSVISTYQTLTAPSPLTETYNLLILTTDQLKSGFEPLATAHDAAGIKTIIKTLTDVGGSTPEDIRSYVRTAYQNWGISYLLLGGDADVVPARILWVRGMDENTTPYEDYLPADHYFGCLDGTYNYDNDGKWGEPTDGDNGGDVDLIAEVYVGRACVGSPTEVSNFVTKTLPFINPTRTLATVSMVGEYLGDYGIASFGDNYVEQLINGSSDDGYTTVGVPASQYQIDRLYEQTWPGFNPSNPWNTGWPPSEIVNRFNNGVLIINHLGHANYDYNMRLENADVDALSNDQTCFVYSQGCMSGGFDNPEGYDCIAEHYTVKTSHAAFAGIWNARYGFFWSYSTDGDSQRFHRQFWDAIFGENITAIGHANQDSKEDNLFMITRSCMRWVYYETNLFGDPTISFGTPSPQPELTIQSIYGGFGSVSATILNNGTLPADSVDWSITVHGGIFKRINVTTLGTIPTLGNGNETTVKTDKFLFGLGTIAIEVNARYADPVTTSGFIIGPFVIISS